MRRENPLRLCGAWLRFRRGMLLLYGFYVLVLFVVYGLYRIGYGPALYAALLCGAVGLGVAFVDFVRFVSRHREMQKLVGRFPTGTLPPCPTLPQQDYADVITALEAERARLTSVAQEAAREDEDYYTLWVHQVKIPISGMRLLLQQEDSGMPPEARSQLEQELFRVEQYVGMVLQYQRLSSLNSDLDFAEHELSALVKQAVKNMAPLFILKKLPLEIAEIEGSLVCDEKWFVFVLEQVLSNALKYTQAGSVRVYRQADGALVVEDTGMGIRPEDLPRIFERGYRGRTGRMDTASTGIGLYLCREILRRLGFGILVESTPGEGTRVLLDLHQNRPDTEL